MECDTRDRTLANCWTGTGMGLLEHNWMMVRRHTNAKSERAILVFVPFLSSSPARVILPKAREKEKKTYPIQRSSEKKVLYPSCKICTQVLQLTDAQYDGMDFRETVVRVGSYACAAHWRKIRGSGAFLTQLQSVPVFCCFRCLAEPSTRSLMLLALSVRYARYQSICAAAAIHPSHR